MRIILWIGNEANQIALANKIMEKYNVVGIVKESRKRKRKYSFSFFINKIYERTFLRPLINSWINLKNYYSNKFPTLQHENILVCKNINHKKVLEFSKSLYPDLILVSGTSLIKKKMFNIKPKNGILNLHTGISPYIKGGPNCTNWCLATKKFHLIGNTIMWIDEGIDSGNILTTEYTPLSGNENLNDLHIKVIEHAHDLYLRSIESIKNGNIQSIPQNKIGKGKTYYSKEWTIHYKMNALKNFKFFKEYYNSESLSKDRKRIKTIKLAQNDKL